MDRYFDTPEAKFDLDIFEEAFDLLIKYNDRDGVGTFWRLMEEMGVEPPDEMREKVCTFIPRGKCWLMIKFFYSLKKLHKNSPFFVCIF